MLRMLIIHLFSLDNRHSQKPLTGQRTARKGRWDKRSGMILEKQKLMPA